MTYEETLHYLYTSIPVFQHSGASAYKPGLGTSIALDDYLGNPHKAYKTIHVAGTNGKGSVSHLLAAILRQSGFKVGLYTSPHLVDFRERIRVNGKKISQDYVVDFVERHRSFFEPLHPSFFELTSSMAFEYFRDQQVDYAVIEVGLGGRLDSTNIITPILSIITNISLDHTQFLGDTEEKIAAEKAGIIKKGVPVLLGEAEKRSVFDLFQNEARKAGAPFHYALSMGMLEGTGGLSMVHWKFPSVEYGEVIGELAGEVQQANAITVFSALHLLREKCGVDILPEAVHEGFGHVTQLTGLMGRWQTLRTKPTVICDTGHNVGGWKHHSGTPECHEKPFPRNLYDRRYGERQGYRRRIILDATRCFLFLHASLRGESDARKGFRHESHAEGTARSPLRNGGRGGRESVKKCRQG